MNGGLVPFTVVSGGQTGADRAALDWAIARGIDHGGWCPKGRAAEDGPIPEQYGLNEMVRKGYAARTERNVIDSDGTLIVSIQKELRGGTRKTREFARAHRRPLLHLYGGSRNAAERLRTFVAKHQIRVLNVAGPRASSEPEIASFLTRILEEAFPSPLAPLLAPKPRSKPGKIRSYSEALTVQAGRIRRSGGAAK